MSKLNATGLQSVRGEAILSKNSLKHKCLEFKEKKI